MTGGYYNIIVVTMIPTLIAVPGSPWNVLPPGFHQATLMEVEQTFTYNPHRRELFTGLLSAAAHLYSVGCRRVLLDGSYVSGKPVPADYDACWDPSGVDFAKLDPVFDDFDDGRVSAKADFVAVAEVALPVEADVLLVDERAVGRARVLDLNRTGDAIDHERRMT